MIERLSVKMMFLEVLQSSQQNTCAEIYFLAKLQTACSFITKETWKQAFSCEFCEAFKNTYLKELE